MNAGPVPRVKAGTLPPVVLTGATGFLGRRVLNQLAAAGAPSVQALARHPESLATSPDWQPGWRAVACDIGRDAIPAGTLPRGSVVLHLAAATGKASPREMRQVNVEGTRRLLQAAKDAGVAHFIFVSSIAASFRDQRWYHYAHAKRQAEALVAASGIPCSIVRPTMIFGPGSPIEAALTGLATGGAPIVLGTGDVAVQPVHVDDLASFLVALAADAPAGGAPMELGGGERLSMRALLARIRAARSLPSRTPTSIPLGFIRTVLGAVEPMLGTALPVSAGQLASFVNDAMAAAHPIVTRLMPAPRGVDAMLSSHDQVQRHVPERPLPPQPSPQELEREFAVFAGYLGASLVDSRLAAAYVRAHQSLANVADDRLDAWLLTLARGGALRCALADCYARRTRPFGLLRRKLVLTLAVLESMPQTHAAFDTAVTSSAMAAWASLVALGVRWGVTTAAAVVTCLPAHLLLAITPAPKRHG